LTRLKRPLPTGEDKVAAVRSMFDTVAPRYDLVNRVMTFGMDVRWRRKAVARLALPEGALVLDVGCGTGDFCRELEMAGHHAIGIDLSAGMLGAARTRSQLVQGDALRMPFRDGTADGVTSGFSLRNVADLTILFHEIARVLRSGGRIAIVEVAEPRTPVVRAGHRLYFRRVVPVIGGLLSDRDAYRYLPQSTAYMPTRPELLALIEARGFSGVESTLVGLGAAQIITGTKT
jgi:demethylmenaquinone methyltransferase / 2-methoxy-6-polyprenyl-1,4-benzoquinol methylase